MTPLEKKNHPLDKQENGSTAANLGLTTIERDPQLIVALILKQVASK